MAKRGKIGKPTKEPMSLQRFEEKKWYLGWKILNYPLMCSGWCMMKVPQCETLKFRILHMTLQAGNLLSNEHKMTDILQQCPHNYIL